MVLKNIWYLDFSNIFRNFPEFSQGAIFSLKLQAVTAIVNATGEKIVAILSFLKKAKPIHFSEYVYTVMLKYSTQCIFFLFVYIHIETTLINVHTLITFSRM